MLCCRRDLQIRAKFAPGGFGSKKQGCAAFVPSRWYWTLQIYARSVAAEHESAAVYFESMPVLLQRNTKAQRYTLSGSVLNDGVFAET